MSLARRRFVGGALLSLLAAGALGAPVGAGSPDTRYVNDDGSGPGSCGSGAFSTIQSAVDASGPGDTVLVCAGTYSEQVVIDETLDGLTLRGVRPWRATVLPPDLLFKPTALIRVEADDAIVQWLRVQARTAGECTEVWAGIHVDGGHGVSIQGNRLSVRGTDTLGDCGLLHGIAVEPGSGATVRNNLVKDFKDLGIAGLGNGSNVRAINNSVRFHHADAFSDATRVARVGSARRVAGGFGPYGIYLEGRGRIVGNALIGLSTAGDGTPAVYIAILTDSPWDGLRVIGNRVRYATWGISSYQDRTIWRNNTVRDVEDAAFEIAANEMHVGPGNVARGSGRGIHVFGDDAFIHDNDFRFNDVDCIINPGASGTTYVDNLGDPCGT
jgi:hypothetical protein